MKIAILGYGKMGKTIEKLALQKGHTIVVKSTSASENINISEADGEALDDTAKFIPKL